MCVIHVSIFHCDTARYVEHAVRSLVRGGLIGGANSIYCIMDINAYYNGGMKFIAGSVLMANHSQRHFPLLHVRSTIVTFIISNRTMNDCIDQQIAIDLCTQKIRRPKKKKKLVNEKW